MKGGYTGFTLSVCRSEDRIESALYIQQYWPDPFYIYTTYQATPENVSRVIFFQNSKLVTLTLFSFDFGSNINQ